MTSAGALLAREIEARIAEYLADDDPRWDFETTPERVTPLLEPFLHRLASESLGEPPG